MVYDLESTSAAGHAAYNPMLHIVGGRQLLLLDAVLHYMLACIMVTFLQVCSTISKDCSISS